MSSMTIGVDGDFRSFVKRKTVRYEGGRNGLNEKTIPRARNS